MLASQEDPHGERNLACTAPPVSQLAGCVAIWGPMPHHCWTPSVGHGRFCRFSAELPGCFFGKICRNCGHVDQVMGTMGGRYNGSGSSGSGGSGSGDSTQVLRVEGTNVVRVPFGVRRAVRKRPQRPDHWATLVLSFQANGGSGPQPPQAA